MCSINPRVDFAFKKLFGSEENKDILLPFLNAILPEQDQIASLELKNPYNLQDYPSDKLSILDIRAIDTRGRHLSIEMQVTDQLYYEKRALFCWSDVYAKQLGAGQGYSELKKTIAIHVLNFNLMDEEAYHNVYKIKNTDTHKVAFEDFQLHTIELKKFNTDLEHLKTSLDRWVTFLTKAHEFSKTKIPEVLQQEPGLEKAITVLDTLFLNEKEREFYDGQLKWLRDEEAAILKALYRGEEKGRAEGRVEGIEEGMAKSESAIVLTMKNNGYAIEDIHKMTGLSLEKIRSALSRDH